MPITPVISKVVARVSEKRRFIKRFHKPLIYFKKNASRSTRLTIKVRLENHEKNNEICAWHFDRYLASENNALS